MDDFKILTIQDISCVGQCSMTVALPILSACGLETAVLPSAVLSTHTAGFQDFTVKDLTEEMPKIIAHWKKEGIRFKALYTGYLGSAEMSAYVMEIRNTLLAEDGVFIFDPAMADNGKLYPAFDEAYVAEMKKLCAVADVVLPNLTEACFLTGTEYKEDFNGRWVNGLIDSLRGIGAKQVVLTGVSFTDHSTGVASSTGGATYYYHHHKYPKGCHGTGDVYSSAFTGAFMRGKGLHDAARIAADFTCRCIGYTQENYPDHWYGVKFEPVLPELIEKL